MRRSVTSCVLLALVAFAVSAEEPAGDAANPAEAEPRRAPITSTAGSAPTETPQQRLERFKREKGAGSDKPFEGFAEQAALEMERRRNEAISAPAQEQLDAEALVETRVGARERLEDQLAKLGAWGGSGCAEIEPAWSAQDDFIRHRKLRADDFRSGRDKSAVAVAVPGAAPTGYAAIPFSCELEPRVQQTSDGNYLARAVRVRYYAVLSRKESWLAEHEPSREAFLVGHQQLHFDMAETFVKWLNQQRETTLARMQGVGRSPAVATGLLQLRWAEHMLAIQDDFDRIETAFDRDTKHGAAPEKQTEWAFRTGDGFDALTKGLKLSVRPKAR